MDRWRNLITEFLDDLDDRIAHNQAVGSTWFDERIVEAEEEAVKLLSDKVNETDGARIADFHNALYLTVGGLWKSAETQREKVDYNSVLVRLEKRKRKK